jgi:Ca2+-binding EF-hand superfamily protein
MGSSLRVLAFVAGLTLTMAGDASAQRGTPPPAREPGAQQAPGGRARTTRPPAGPGAARITQDDPGRGQDDPRRAQTPDAPITPDDDGAGIQVPDGRLRQWFGFVDADGNGWLSLRETSSGLDFDAGRFRSFDVDKDGRMTIAEYKNFYIREIEAGHPPSAPRSTVTKGRVAPRRDELQLRVAFDRDLDGALDTPEFATLLAEYGQGDLDARMVFQRADGNGDQRLDLAELTRVAVLLDPLAQSQKRAAPPMARSLSELFGAHTARTGEGQPPYIAGPVPTFWRLDIDGDGFIEDEDLAILQGHTHMPISVGAVKSALDRDGDGRLSALEFAMALDPNVRPESPAPAR